MFQWSHGYLPSIFTLMSNIVELQDTGVHANASTVSLPSFLNDNPPYLEMGVMRGDAVLDGLIAESEPVVQDRVLQDK